MEMRTQDIWLLFLCSCHQSIPRGTLVWGIEGKRRTWIWGDTVCVCVCDAIRESTEESLPDKIRKRKRSRGRKGWLQKVIFPILFKMLSAWLPESCDTCPVASPPRPVLLTACKLQCCVTWIVGSGLISISFPKRSFRSCRASVLGSISLSLPPSYRSPLSQGWILSWEKHTPWSGTWR